MRVYFITIPIPLLITKYNIDKKKTQLTLFLHNLIMLEEIILNTK